MAQRQVLTDLEALERFRDAHPDLELRDLVAMSEDQFVRAHSEEFFGEASSARRAHRLARDLAAASAHLWANLRDLTSPVPPALPFRTPEAGFVRHQDGIADYRRLFGDPVTLECDESRSVFGPAAYLVDLLRFVDQRIDQIRHERPSERLENRRPDLFRLELDRDNAFELVGTIDLVIDALASIVSRAEERDAEAVLADSRRPWEHLPFDVPLAELRAYLTHLGTSLLEVYELVGPEVGEGQQHHDHVLGERLGLSAEELNIVTEPLRAGSLLTDVYGVDGIDQLSDVDAFLRSTGLTRRELAQLVDGDLDRAELDAGLSRRFFVNDVDDGLGPITIEVDDSDPNRPVESLRNLSTAKLDRIHRFVRLARRLSWTLIELQQAVESLHPRPPVEVLQFDGLDDAVQVDGVTGLDLRSFTVEAWVRPERRGTDPIVVKGHRGAPATDAHFALFVDPEGRLAFFRGRDEGYKRSQAELPLGSFSHVAVTVEPVAGVDRARVGFVVNGRVEPALDTDIATERDVRRLVDVVDPDLHPALEPVGDLLSIGRGLDDTGFAGAISDVRIWSTVRTTEQIGRMRFDRLTGRETGLAAYWPLTPDRWALLRDLGPDANTTTLGGPGHLSRPRWVGLDLGTDPLPLPLAGGAHFDGGSQYMAARGVTGLDSDLSGRGLTIEAWIEPDRSGAGPLLVLRDTGGVLVELGLDASGHLVLAGGSGPTALSDGPIPPGRATHVAAAVHGGIVAFHVDGVPAGGGGVGVPDSIGGEDLMLLLGHDFEDGYFEGTLREVRLWDRPRTSEEIDAGRHRRVPVAAPGLIGYWPLDFEVTAPGHEGSTTTPDRSRNANHLWIGGDPQDHRPEPVDAPVFLPAAPIATLGPALRLDGENDLVLVGDATDRGLGRRDRATLELWFAPDDLGRADPQVLVSEGDAEAGLSVFLHGSRLSLLTWSADYELTSVVEHHVASSPLDAAGWHHLAVTVEDPGPATTDPPTGPHHAEVGFWVDGSLVSLERVEGLRLATVGPLHLGGLPAGAVTRFQGAYIDDAERHRHFFTGRITDLRLWSVVRTADQVEADRWAAPSPDADGLVVWLPLDQATGVDFGDPRPDGPLRRLRGRLSRANVAVCRTEASGSETTPPDGSTVTGPPVHFLSYRDGSAAAWSDYTFRGRFRVPERAEPGALGALGVTFLSQAVADRERYYRLGLVAGAPTVRLASHPTDLQALDGDLDSGVVPEPGRWYRFAVRVESAATHTSIQAKVWPDADPEPEGYQIEAVDGSLYRIEAGTVGVCTDDRGTLLVDDLLVVSHRSGEVLLDETFERWDGRVRSGDGSPGPQWQPVVSRDVVEAADVLVAVELDGQQVLAVGSDDAPLDHVLLSQYTGQGASTWRNYAYTGRFLVGDSAAALGFTVAGQGRDVWYRLRFAGHRPSIHLDAGGREDARLQGRLDSGYVPQPGGWHRFHVEVEDLADRTAIRAVFWPEGETPPVGMQVDAYDAHTERLRHGTVGLWTVGGGVRYVDNLAVTPLPLQVGTDPVEHYRADFGDLAVGEHPGEWRDTGRDNADTAEQIFTVQEVDGAKVLSTSSHWRNAHTHLDLDGVLAWSNYEVTGRMRVSSLQSGLGITILSRYPEIYHPDQRDPAGWDRPPSLRPLDRPYNRYYRLRRLDTKHTWHLKVHPDPESDADWQHLPLEPVGVDDSGLVATSRTWHRFRLGTTDTGSATRIWARVWEDGTEEPDDFQIDVLDHSEHRLISGGVGLWISGPGVKHVADLVVGHVTYMQQRGGVVPGHRPDGWTDTVTRPWLQDAASTWTLVTTDDNRPRLLPASDVPLVRRPVGRWALRFDGRREYADGMVVLEEGSPITVEAWVRHQGGRGGTILAVGGAEGVTVGLDDGGRPEVRSGADVVVGDAPLSADFGHLAVAVDGRSVNFVVDGRSAGAGELAAPAAVGSVAVHLGTDGRGSFFAGDLCDVRLWSRARTAIEVDGQRFHRPDEAETGLVAHWPVTTVDGDTVAEPARPELALRGGGRPPDRCPGPGHPTPPRAEPNELVPVGAVRFGPASSPLRGDVGNQTVALQRRTVEVWFRPAGAMGRQVLYHQGTAEEGLALYLDAGELHAAAWHVGADGDGWSTGRLAGGAVGTGHWHQAALVLDGRSEVRPESVRLYVDGALADAAAGSELRADTGRFWLGGAGGQVRIPTAPDGESDAEGGSDVDGGSHLAFAGEVAGLRIWATARSAEQIWATRHHELDAADRHRLLLWWQVVMDDDGAPLLVERTGLFAPAVEASSVVPFTGPDPQMQPADELDRDALRALADVTTLRERTALPLRSLTTLWAPPRSSAVTGTDPQPDVGAAQDNRVATLSRLVGLAVDDLRWLMALVGTPATPSTADIVALVGRVDWLERVGLDIGDLQRIVAGHGPWTLGVTHAHVVDLAAAADIPQPTDELGELQGVVEDELTTSGLLDRGGLVWTVAPEDLGDSALRTASATLAEASAGDLERVRSILGRRLALQREVAIRLVADQDRSDRALAAQLADVADLPAALVGVVLDHLRGEAAEPTGAAELTALLDRIGRLVGLAQSFDLGATELRHLLTDPRRFDITSVQAPTLADLERLQSYRELRDALSDSEATLASALGQPRAQAISLLSRTAGWPERTVASLIGRLGGSEAGAPPAMVALTTWVRVHRIFALSRATGAPVDLLVGVADGAAGGVGPRRALADAVADVAHTRSGQDWARVHGAIHDEIGMRTRDGLLPVATRALARSAAGRAPAELLSDYLLADVEVGPEVKTSRIVEAIAAVQLYVQRCLLHLEDGVDVAEETVRVWEWMKNYRVWEANRKVFLYPESYLEPELRDTKTPLFAELEQALSQVDLDGASAAGLVSTYLTGFTGVADLHIVGSYHHRPPVAPNAPRQPGVLHLIGRTRTDPWIYHHRQVSEGGTWGPWHRIDLPIDARHVSPVFAFGRLFIFWPEFKKVTESRDRRIRVRPTAPGSKQFVPVVTEGGATAQDVKDVAARRKSIELVDGSQSEAFLYNVAAQERVKENVDVHLPEVKYSFLNDDGTWSAPQGHVKVDRRLRDEERVRPEWQRVYVQSRSELEVRSSQPREFADVAVLRVSRNTDLVAAMPIADTSSLTLSFLIQLESTLTPAQLTGAAGPGELRRRTLRVVSYPGAGGTAITIENTFHPHPAAPDLDRFRKEAIAAEHARDDAGRRVDEAAAELAAATDAKDAPRIAAAQRAHDMARQAFTQAEMAEADAVRALQTALGQPQWEERVQLRVTGQSGAPVELAYGAWQHVIAVLSQHGTAYRGEVVVATQDGRASADVRRFSIGSVPGPLPAHGDLVVGQADASGTEEAFVARMSELRMWDYARVAPDPSGTQPLSAEVIADDLFTRKVHAELGLFHLALDEAHPGAQMVMEPSTLTLTESQPPVPEVTRQRERIILFYGDVGQLIQSNFGAGGVTATLERSGTADSYDLDLAADRRPGSHQALVLYVKETRGLSVNDYVTGESSGLIRLDPTALEFLAWLVRIIPNHPLRPLIDQLLAAHRPPSDYPMVLTKLPQASSAVADVGNQPGWYVLDTGDESFLLQAVQAIEGSNPTTYRLLDLKTAAERLEFRYAEGVTAAERQPVAVRYADDPALVSSTSVAPYFRATRLTSHVGYGLHERLLEGGVDGLLSRAAQTGTSELAFARYGTQGGRIAIAPPDQLDFDGPNAPYLYELFFHVPLLIASRLNGNQRYADAQRWFHFVFNPMAADDGSDVTDGRLRPWRFEPFRTEQGRDEMDKLADLLEPGNEALDAYRRDPFDPHAIAALRLVAYMKSVVIRYVDNLLDWADSLFATDRRESITEALQLYQLAATVLGPRPDQRPARSDERVGSYETIRRALTRDRPNDPVRTRLVRDTAGRLRRLEADTSADVGAVANMVPDFVTAYLLAPLHEFGSDVELIDNGAIFTTFCVPENDKLLAFWDRVEDRIHKIRHSLNIEGVFRQLALFAPPIEPGELVRATAATGSVAAAVEAGGRPVPHYRYAALLEVAKDAAGTVAGMGSALLSAIESRDAERLTALAGRHERSVLELMTSVKRTEIDAARETLEALRSARRGIEHRRDGFQSLIDAGLSPEEIADLTLRGIAGGIRTVTGVLRALEGVLNTLPSAQAGAAGIFSSPVALVALDSANYSAPVNAGIEIANVVAGVLEVSAGLTSTIGGYRRREDGWKHDLRAAELDLEGIEHQIAGAEHQLANAERELAIHERILRHNQQTAEFHRRKFSNEELYGWMVGRLSALHFQAYRLAHGLARSAERALQYELPTDETFIGFGQWNGLRQGLLAGESLGVELLRMDAARLEQDSRFLEVERNISMRDEMRERLEVFKATGVCEFELTKQMFDRDHPGHFFRVIKTVAVSIRVPVDAHRTINASLVQVKNETEVDSGGTNTRVNLRPTQQIAISRVDEDDGMFVLNFFLDDRYFPFEGTGAVSSWRLTMGRDANPAVDFDAIEDVIVHLRYTAKPSAP